MTRRAPAQTGAAAERVPGLAPTVGATTRAAPRGVHPEPWRLAETLLAARQRLPYATAEARLLDGLQRWVALECKAPAGGVSLAPAGPRWAQVVAAVAAVASLCSDDTRTMLAPWAGATAPAAGAPGISPHAGVAFETLGGTYTAVYATGPDPTDDGFGNAG